MQPRSESPLVHFWGAGGIFFTIVFAVVAVMAKDLRWLLFIAWPFSVVAIWDFMPLIAVHGRKTKTSILSIVSLGVLCLLYAYLQPVGADPARVALSELSIYDLKQKTKALTADLRTLSQTWMDDRHKLLSGAESKLRAIDQVGAPEAYKKQVIENVGNEVDMNYKYIMEYISKYQEHARAFRAEIYKREGVSPPYPFSFGGITLDNPSGMVALGPSNVADLLDAISAQLSSSSR